MEGNNVKKYEIYRSTSKNGTYKRVKTITSAEESEGNVLYRIYVRMV